MKGHHKNAFVNNDVQIDKVIYFLIIKTTV
jgi:hypothetical protein